jgi:very-short-patch-repair endonuclease
MSLSRRKELSKIAIKLCRELRVNQTESEKLLWSRIRNRKLLGKKFLRQHPIFFDLSGKETFYIADFYCHELKLVVEIDGEIHKYKKNKDEERDKILELLGLAVIRIKNELIMNSINEVFYSLKKTMVDLESNSP